MRRCFFALVLVASCAPGHHTASQTPCRESTARSSGKGEPQAEALVQAGTFAVGDRVSCNWKSGGTYYDGSVGELLGDGRIFIRYDDGDVEETTPEMCRQLTAAAEPPGGGGGLAGSYAIVSSANPGGGAAYTGNVQIASAGGAYRLSWSIPGSPPYSGVGIEMNGVLAVGWGTGATPGVVVYRVSGGQLAGKWAGASGGALGSEDLSGPAGLSGSYKITRATNPGGGSYTGTVAISKNGPTYSLAWTLPNESYAGVGILSGDVLSVGWGSGGAGVVSYKIRGKRLEGTWADGNGGAVGSEVLERR